MGLMPLIIGNLAVFDVKTSPRRSTKRWDHERKFHVRVLGGVLGGKNIVGKCCVEPLF